MKLKYFFIVITLLVIFYINYYSNVIPQIFLNTYQNILDKKTIITNHFKLKIPKNYFIASNFKIHNIDTYGINNTPNFLNKNFSSCSIYIQEINFNQKENVYKKIINKTDKIKNLFCSFQELNNKCLSEANKKNIIYIFSKDCNKNIFKRFILEMSIEAR